MVIRGPQQDREMKKILISACLVGQKVRYDGQASRGDEQISVWQAQGRLVPICPEVSGGLGVPRPAAEVVDGTGEDVLVGAARLMTADGVDVTEAFVAGARQALKVAQKHGVVMAILKARSPSCGSSTIYDGTFSGKKRDGMGVTAALLRSEGIAVFSDEELEKAARFLGTG